MASDYLALYEKYLIAEKGSSANTVSAYLRDVTQFQEFLHVEEDSDLRHAAPEMVQRYMDWMHGKGKSAASVTRFLASVVVLQLYGVFRCHVRESCQGADGGKGGAKIP